MASTKKNVVQVLSEPHPVFHDKKFPLSKHMYAYWHRFSLSRQFNINSARSRLDYVTYYIWDMIAFRDVSLQLDVPSLIADLNAPVMAWGYLTTFWHSVWIKHFRGRFDIYDESGYHAYLAHVATEEVPHRLIPQVLFPASLLAVINMPQPGIAAPSISRAFFHRWHGASIYRECYDIAKNSADRDLFMIDQIIHVVGEPGREFLLSAEEERYWSGSPISGYPTLSRMVLLLARISSRFGRRLSSGILTSEMVDEIQNWWKKDVAADMPSVLRFAPMLTPQAINLSDHALYSMGRARRRVTPQKPDVTNGKIEVLLIGALGAASGLGAGMRRVVGALDKAGVDYRIFPFFYDMPSAIQYSDLGDRLYRGEMPERIIWQYNGEYIFDVMTLLPDFSNCSYNVGYFFWETAALPEAHKVALELVDEVWVPSEFCRKTYEGHGVPVVAVGSSVELPKIDRFLSRSELGLDEDVFIVAFSYDSHSVIHRKNPAAVVQAFKRAFPKGTEKARLVLKTQNMGTAHWNGVRGRGEELLELVSSDPRIIFFDKTMTLQELYSVKKACDVYVSLHRSEGYGYGPAEAMALGKPVIMTRYSSTGEFESGENCIMIDGPLIHVENDEYLYQVPEMVWADPDIDQAARAIRLLYDDPNYARKLGGKAAETINREHSVDVMAARVRKRLEELEIVKQEIV
ncbi:glycosyltransferase family 4 protein [Gluconacetobacter sp.]|uniref:glycosyltransferase family 4 protein n=1 Tax=Gluconacetobacter sp. TaxID=1935994 RepID=UPI0039EC0A04